MTKKNPLVSCLCITENRVGFLARAYECYRAQTYDNLELVVVCMDDDLATFEFLQGLGVEDSSINIVKVNRAERGSLGRLRNLAVNRARGDYICVWDDDDIYHADRVKKSMEAIASSSKPAVTLSNVIIRDVQTGNIYSSTRRSWEQTLICNRRFLQENNIYYADLDCYEDTPLIEKLWMHIFLLSDPSLYIYNFHASNTSNEKHFQRLLKIGIQLPEPHQKLINEISNREIDLVDAAGEMQKNKLLKNYPLLKGNTPAYWGSFRLADTSNQ